LHDCGDVAIKLKEKYTSNSMSRPSVSVMCDYSWLRLALESAAFVGI